MKGELALVLHAHLPFVRHAEHDRFFEESWLYEAVAECYLPLLQVLFDWEKDRVDWALTLGITPTLGSMLEDSLLSYRVRRYLSERIDLADREEVRTRGEAGLQSLARFHGAFYRRVTALWDSLDGDLLGAFRTLADTGRLELLGGPATHPVLPLLVLDAGSLQAQIELGCREHQRRFGKRPRGFWLPECAWCPAIEPALHAAGIQHVVVETRAVTEAQPPPLTSVFGPVRTLSGLIVFGRDPATAHQVWSRAGGYPGDPRYREFYRDLGFEANWESIRPYLPGAGARGFTGIKYHRVTGGSGPKALYERGRALEAVAEHANHFLQQCAQRCGKITPWMKQSPLIVAPYDAELFGHWWFEGPEFLAAVQRGAASSGIRMVTLSARAGDSGMRPKVNIVESSWGEGGHLGVWLDPSNAFLQPRLGEAGLAMSHLAHQVIRSDVFQRKKDFEERTRCAKECARNLLLAQASDWPFLMRMGTASGYARRRFERHLEAFWQEIQWLQGSGKNINPRGRPEIETSAGCSLPFPEIDLRWWLNPELGSPQQ